MNYLTIAVLCLFGLASLGCLHASDGTSSSGQGYTNKILIPKEGLSEEEKKYLDIIVAINNDVLSETQNVVEIAAAIAEICKPIWGDFHNQFVRVSFGTRPTSESTYRMSTIYIDGPPSAIYNDHRVVAPMIEHVMSRSPIVFLISGGQATPGFQMDEKSIFTIWFPLPDSRLTLIFNFHSNGMLKLIEYWNSEASRVKRSVQWDEDGQLVSEEEITTPRPKTALFG